MKFTSIIQQSLLVVLSIFLVLLIAKTQINNWQKTKRSMPLINVYHNIDNDKKASEEEEPKEQRIKERFEQELLMTQNPRTKSIPKEKLLVAQKVKEQKILAGVNSLIPGVNWVERGPNNIAGRTRAILVDIADTTNNTVFAGGVAGGLWKATSFLSTNPTWTQLDDFFDNLAVSAIVQDPINPNIIYFGTGEGWGNADAVPGLGIWKSTDGGGNWSNLGSTSGYRYIKDIEIDGNGALYITTNNSGVLQSVDGGNNWVQVLSTTSTVTSNGNNANDLELGADGDIYVSTSNWSGGQIFKSDQATHSMNTGNMGNWMDITPSGNFARIELACAPSDSNRIYALCQGENSDNADFLFRSDNGGASWITITSPGFCDAGGNSSNFARGQAWYDLIAAVDPSNPDRVYIGGVDALRSEDGGQNWTQISGWAQDDGNFCDGLAYIHADHHEILFLPGSSTEMIWGTDGGISYTANGTAATPSFVTKNSGYNITQYYSCALHPGYARNYILGGTQDNGTHQFSNAGMNNVIEVTGGDGGFCHIDQNNPMVQITSYIRNNYFVSLNGGSNFLPGPGVNSGFFINITDYDNAAQKLYAANEHGDYLRWNNPSTGGNDYEVVATGFSGVATAITTDPHTNNRVWFGHTNYNSNGEVGLAMVDNANGIPTTTNLTIPNDILTYSWTSSIAIDPNDGDHLLISYSNYGVISVWEVTNATSANPTWTNVEGDLPDMPIRWALFNPNNTDQAFLATDVGVWSTDNLNGNNTDWNPTNSGLANVRVDMLQYRSSDNLIAAATHGRGMFTFGGGTATCSDNILNGDEEGIDCGGSCPICPCVTNGGCTNAITLSTSLCNGESYDMSCVSAATIIPSCSTTDTIYDIWFKFTAPSTGIIELYLEELNTDDAYYFTLYENTCGTNEFICNQNTGFNGNLIENLNSGQTYYLQVWTPEVNRQNIQICITNQCTVSAMTLGDVVTCNTENNTFDQELIVNYECLDLPIFGNTAWAVEVYKNGEYTTISYLPFNSGKTTDTLLLSNLPVDGSNYEIYAYLCAGGRYCWSPQYLSFTETVCSNPTCTDGIKNGEETDIDCGGSSCEACLCYNGPFFLSITFDDYPEETSWVIIGANLDTLHRGGPYINAAPGETIVIDSLTLPEGVNYTLVFFDALSDGICCGFGNGAFSLKDNTGTIIESGGKFTSESRHYFCTNQGCDHPDLAALIALYNATDGINWTVNTNWDTTRNTSCNPCTDNWEGIICEDNRVTEIFLYGNNLRGSIPTELSQLDKLKTLGLWNNELTGNIPVGLGQLTDLELLGLDQNQLTGNIPSELGQLNNLKQLWLNVNQLTGTIPSELSQLSNLKLLLVSTNQLTGSIPKELGQLSDLKYLSLGHNRLIGNIPVELSQLTKLEELSLDSNLIAGNIPKELSQLDSLRHLNLSNNELIGDIPPELGQMNKLQRLYLNGNQLSGCIPIELSVFCNAEDSVNISNNPNLDEQDFAAFCTTNSGQCIDNPCDTDTTGYCTDVWPGDFNNDGIVDYVDFLYWNLGEMGPVRPDASSEWIGQPAPDWPTNRFSVNSKHQDANGDGIVDYEDEVALVDNYNRKHKEPNNIYPQSNLFFKIERYYEDWAKDYLAYKIYLKNTSNEPIDLHGIATVLDFGDILLDTVFLAPPQQLSLFGNFYFNLIPNDSTQVLLMGSSKNDSIPSTINDTIPLMTVTFTSKDLFNSNTTNRLVHLNATGKRVSTDGVVEDISGSNLYDTYLGRMMSLPDDFIATVSSTPTNCSKLGTAKVDILSGAEPYTIQWSTGATTAEIDGLAAGVYGVTIEDNQGTIRDYSFEVVEGCLDSSCPENLSISEDNLASTQQAAKSIESTSQLLTNSNVIYKAGESITLKPGFHAPTSSNFLAKIENCVATTLKTLSDNSLTIPSSIPPDDFTLNVFPNPMNYYATITFDLPKAGITNLNILDIQGKPIHQLLNAYRDKGKHELEWNRTNVPKGIYLIQLQTESGTKTTKIIVLD